jgi:hypothetical protein
MDEGAHAQRREVYLVLDSGLDSGIRDLNGKEEALADILDLFFGPGVGVGWALGRVGRSFLIRTFGDETISGPGLSGLFEVAKRANNGGTGGGGAAPRGIGDDGTGFAGGSLFFLRRKPAMSAVGGGCQKRRWK